VIVILTATIIWTKETVTATGSPYGGTNQLDLQTGATGEIT
jgi:hypothetical protein